VEIRSAREDDAERWDSYVAALPASSAYHRFGWKRVVEKSFGHQTHYLMAEDGQQVLGVLPLVRLKSMMFGNFMVSLPYFTYGGVCAGESGAGEALMQEAVSLARGEGSSHVEFRETAPRGCGLPVKTSKVSMRLDLASNPDELWGSFGSKLRSQIRRPGKEGMVARIGREGELDSFYRVFSTNMRDLGTPVYAKRFFANILAEFPDSTWIHTVYTKDGQAVASGFVLRNRDMLEIPWASSLRAHNRHSPNSLLYWSVLSLACEKGCRLFDFGRSTPGEGTFRFKEQWGARPVQLYWHYWLKRGGALPELNPKNRKFRAAIGVWRRLPVGVTRVLGPLVVRNLP
jgi:FemAB-related protein (PEP-CTERM system-associated)